MSRGICDLNKGKFAKTSNRGQFFLYSQNETTILVMQNLQFEF